MQIYKSSRVVMSDIKKKSLYYLEAQVITGSSDATESVVSDMKNWHVKLGHLGQKGLMQLVKKGVIQAQESGSIKNCEQCALGKNIKQPFSKAKHTSTSVLEYAHSDIWGPSQPPTMNGGKYFITIIDDFSRKLWVKILKEKSEAFKFFKEWHTMVEREKGALKGGDCRMRPRHA